MKKIRNRHIFILDILLCLAAYIIALGIAFPVSQIFAHFGAGALLIGLTTGIYAIFMYVWGIYNIDWL